MTLDATQWTCAVVGAIFVGISKTAIGGLGALAVALFAYVFPSSKQASGLLLPLLVFADFVAVFSYRRHTQWGFVIRLFPWTALGVLAGYFALGRTSDHHVKLMIGSIILALALLAFWRRYGARRSAEPQPVNPLVGPGVGMLAGFVTLIANAAGPLMAIYLVAMRLPKMQYVGTAAVFFMAVNLFKLPFMAALGLVTVQSFTLNLMLLPAVLAGAAAGRWLLHRIDQDLFERLVLGLSAVAGVLLLI